MRLIGMLDSPYVRRVAISARLMGIDIALNQLSVFRTFDEFRAINPVVKAPSLVTDAGVVLMESGLILDYLESLAGPARSLMPSEAVERVRALRVIGLALAGCEKAVQIIYERNLRPPEKQHQLWLDRVSGQMHAAFAALEEEAPQSGWFGGSRLQQADVTAAVAWHFAQHSVPEIAAVKNHPRLAALSARAEIQPAFKEMAF